MNLRILACVALALPVWLPQAAVAKPFLLTGGATLIGGQFADVIEYPPTGRVFGDHLLQRGAGLAVRVDDTLAFDLAADSWIRLNPCEVLATELLDDPVIVTGGLRFLDDLRRIPCRGGAPGGGGGGGAGTTNHPPAADAGPDQAIETLSTTTVSVTLDGSGSSDPDGDSLSYAWSGPFGTAIGATVTVDLAADVTHAISLSVTDSHGASDTDTVLVTVTTIPDTTAPVLTPPATLTVEATGEFTVVALGNATAIDDTDPTPAISNDAPAGGFPPGVTTVTWTATDASGNSASAMQTVTVVDTTPPAITAPAAITVEATGPGGAVVTLPPPAVSDLVDPAPVIVASPPSGSTFPLGATTVTWTATDASGNSATAMQTVTVIDTTPPAITAPAAITVEATGPAGAAVALPTPAVSDLVDPAPAIAASPPSDSTFPLGSTTVTWTATDASGNSASATQAVTVVDTTPPVVTPPPDVTAAVAGPLTEIDLQGALAGATDLVDGALTPVPDSTGPFPAGVTTVTWSATDGAGNTGSATQTVTVSYAFGGFEPPVEDLPAVNAARAGSTVPVKWQLPDGNGGFIRDPGVVVSLQVAPTACASADNVYEIVEDADAVGQTGLRYDLADEQFVYGWKTDKEMGRGCFLFILALNDGTIHMARFDLK